jgi:hypothetical protein
MQRYGNASGNSGVLAFDAGSDFILVQFRGGDIYRYSESLVGREHVERMKELAASGKGLSTYISQHREVHGGGIRE